MKDRIGSQRLMVFARFALLDSSGGDETRLPGHERNLGIGTLRATCVWTGN
jgi:hypothetical protein